MANQEELSLSLRLGRALAFVNADLKTRSLAISELKKVLMGEITEDQMDPVLKSILKKAPIPKRTVTGSGIRKRKGFYG